MNVFTDTEFSGLRSDPRLISIALVAEQGAELYIELTSGWNVEQCSRWVVEHVLPMLGDGEKLPRWTAAHRINDWIGDLDAKPTLIVDSDWDAELIAGFFEENGIAADRHPIHVLKFESKADADAHESARQDFFRTGGCQHHALADARALRFAWITCRESQCAKFVFAGASHPASR